MVAYTSLAAGSRAVILIFLRLVPPWFASYAACRCDPSGIIGNQLFVAGGYQLRTLQVYDIAGRTFVTGIPAYGTLGVVLDGKPSALP